MTMANPQAPISGPAFQHATQSPAPFIPPHQLNVAPQQQQPGQQQSQQQQQFQPEPQVQAQPFLAPSQVPPPVPQPVQNRQQQQQQQTSAYDPIYQSVSEAMQIPVEQVRQVFRDDPAQFGQLISSAAKILKQQRQEESQAGGQQQPPQFQQGQAQQQQQPQVVPAIAYQYLKKRDDGFYEPLVPDPQVAQWAQIENSKIFERQQRANQLVDDPSAILQDPKVSNYIQEQIKSTLEAERKTKELADIRNNYRSKYQPFVVEHDANGNVVYDFQGNPKLTRLGESFNRHFIELSRSGMQESSTLYEYAMQAAERETGILAQQQQQQPMPFGGFGNPPQTLLNQPQQQPLQQPSIHALVRRNQNQAAITQQPGMAPIRPMQPNGRASLRDVTQARLQGMPDGLPFNQYWEAVFGKQS